MVTPIRIAALALLTLAVPARAQQADMSFFVTSAGIGKGADLGGLAGADKHCQGLAEAAGSKLTNWHAYLSTQGADAVNARDRIGAGPWKNAKGELIASNVEDLHGAGNHLTKATALTERGAVVNGRGDNPNTHDILTGSSPEGRTIAGEADTTCKGWTSSTAGAAMLGHSDRTGLDQTAPAISWNSSHLSRGPGGGCSQDDLKTTGGAGLLYCFAGK